MNGIEELSTHPAAVALARALLHFLWQGSLVALALAAVLATARRARPSVRYAAACAALAVLPALLLLTVLYTGSAGDSPPAGLLPAVGAVPAPGADSVPAATSQLTPQVREAAVAAAQMSGGPLGWVTGLWLLGVLCLSGFHLIGWLRLQALRRRGARPAPEGWDSVLARLCRRLGVRQAVRLAESSAVAVPSVLGWLRPVILVPASAFAGLAPHQLEAILAHELAHVRRRDYLVNLLQAVVETLLFYHPAVWWISRQVRLEREHCCDDLAVATTGDRLAYARALATMETLRQAPAGLALAADGGSLVERVRRLAGVPRRSSLSAPGWLAGAAVLLLVLAVATMVPAVVEVSAEEEARIAGTYSAEVEDDGRHVQLSLRRSGSDDSWSFRIQVDDPEEFLRLPGQLSGGVMTMVNREAGFLELRGLSDAEGYFREGSFEFRPSPAYVEAMRQLGHEDFDDEWAFQFAVQDVSLDFVRGLAEPGHGEVGLERILEMAIQGSGPELIDRRIHSSWRPGSFDPVNPEAWLGRLTEAAAADEEC